jgi:hypothetical protein
LYLAEKCVVEATIKEKMVQNTFTDMVDNETMEGPLLLPALVGGGGGYSQGQEGEGSRPTMDEGLPNTQAHYDPFQKIAKLE